MPFLAFATAVFAIGGVFGALLWVAGDAFVGALQDDSVVSSVGSVNLLTISRDGGRIPRDRWPSRWRETNL